MPPHVTRIAPTPVGITQTVYVISATHKLPAADALRRSGFEIVGDLASAGFVARFTVGVDKSFGNCGTLNNVKLALTSHERQVLEIAARGWTGACHPNVFDDMARVLQQEFVDVGTQPGMTGGGNR